jgi:ATP-binding cassette subfamily B multidrug efflux pump
MADNFNVLQMGMINADRVFQMMDKDESQAEDANAPSPLQGEVRFSEVDFYYNPDQPILEKFSLDIPFGKMVALVGHTGSGKSTVVQLLNRLYEPQGGIITWGGRDVRHFSLDDLRNKIAVVPQDVFLFSDSIFNNLTLNDASITKEQVISACKKVGIHDFIERLPGGYGFNVRERGIVLSVGQRQLMAFVRAYLKNPEILILDEATSSVDSESEQQIQRATEVITEGRTSIVIAHRLSTIQKADKIVVMEKGRKMEEGNHDALIQLNGMYAKLYQRQFLSYES